MSIFIIDDVESNLMLLSALARKVDADVPIVTETCPLRALERLGEVAPEVIFVDYMMPGMDGVAFIAEVRRRAATAEIPIVMVTTADQRAVRIAALEAGATEFLAKPIDPTEFRVRLRNLLQLSKATRNLKDRAAWLAEEVSKATAALLAREEEIIIRLARAAEYRDPETGSHILRMATYSRMVAEALGLDRDYCNTLYLAAPMHDIGKIGVADSILLKPGPLTDEERAAMQLHASYGEQILKGSSSSLVCLASEIACTHHERWDGTGYPRGLKGEEIPLSGRITAVADVFDALTSDRPYKPAWSPEDAARLIFKQKGQHFDPACVDAFLSRWDDVLRVRAA